METGLRVSGPVAGRYRARLWSSAFHGVAGSIPAFTTNNVARKYRSSCDEDFTPLKTRQTLPLA